MEVEHFVGISVALIISLILMWVVWSYFCQDKSEEDDGQNETEDSFTSTYVITTTHKKAPHRRAREASLSSCNDGTTEDESEAENNRSRSQRPRRKTKKSRTSSYLCQKSNYGLADPFAEWAPDQKQHQDRTPSPQLVYPKSPVLKHKVLKKDHSAIDL